MCPSTSPRSASRPQFSPDLGGARARVENALRSYAGTMPPAMAELYAAVVDLARVMRTAGEPPERLLITIKQEMADVLGVPRDLYGLGGDSPSTRLVSQIVTWCVEAYYRPDADSAR